MQNDQVEPRRVAACADGEGATLPEVSAGAPSVGGVVHPVVFSAAQIAHPTLESSARRRVLRRSKPQVPPAPTPIECTKMDVIRTFRRRASDIRPSPAAGAAKSSWKEAQKESRCLHHPRRSRCLRRRNRCEWRIGRSAGHHAKGRTNSMSA